MTSEERIQQWVAEHKDQHERWRKACVIRDERHEVEMRLLKEVARFRVEKSAYSLSRFLRVVCPVLGVIFLTMAYDTFKEYNEVSMAAGLAVAMAAVVAILGVLAMLIAPNARRAMERHKEEMDRLAKLVDGFNQQLKELE